MKKPQSRGGVELGGELRKGKEFEWSVVGVPPGVETIIRCQGGTGVDNGQWWMIWCGTVWG